MLNFSTVLLSKKKRRCLLLLVFFSLLLALCVWDYLRPVARINHYEVDAQTLGGLETEMWHAYYDRRMIRLHWFLVELLHEQVRFGWIESSVNAFRAVRAAAIFGQGMRREDYARAIPLMTTYYRSICRAGNLRADPKRVAYLEVNWWVIHREVAEYGPAELAGAIAETVAALYGGDKIRFLSYGRLRAEAMRKRDDAHYGKGMQEKDWQAVKQDLVESYRALNLALSAEEALHD